MWSISAPRYRSSIKFGARQSRCCGKDHLDNPVIVSRSVFSCSSTLFMDAGRVGAPATVLLLSTVGFRAHAALGADEPGVFDAIEP